MVWYSHLLKSFPQFVMIHTVKGFIAQSMKQRQMCFFWNSLAFSLYAYIHSFFQVIFFYQPLRSVEQSSLGCTLGSFSYPHALLHIFQCLANLVLDSSQLACREGKEVSGPVDVYFLGIGVMVHRLIQRALTCPLVTPFTCGFYHWAKQLPFSLSQSSLQSHDIQQVSSSLPAEVCSLPRYFSWLRPMMNPHHFFITHSPPLCHSCSNKIWNQCNAIVGSR